MTVLKKAKSEKSLLKEQNEIKKYLECIAVYDIPKKYKNMTTSIFVSDYGKKTEKYRLYIYIPKQ